MATLGAYAIEKDYSHYVSKQSDVILGVVGTATKGPVNTPTLCTSTVDLIRKFGPVTSTRTGLYAGLYYLSQGNQFYFTRAQGTTAAAKASVVIPGKDSGDTVVTPVITLTASTPGTYYNSISIVVSQATTGYKFVLSSNGVTLESVLYTIGGRFRSSYVDATIVSTSTFATITAGTYTLTGGTDSDSNLTDADWVTAIDTFSNSAININLLATPGLSSSAVIAKGLSVCSTRGDAMYIIDPPANLDPSDVKDWHNGEGEYTSTSSLINNSYGAIYYPWVYVYDSTSDTDILMPPSVVVGSVLAKSARESEIWLPPAGLVRGLVSGVSRPQYSVNSGEMNSLYSDTNCVNCIIEDPTYGLVVFGQKTTSRATTSLNRVNVRMLLNYLKRVIVAASMYLTFEPNDSTTWNSFEDLVEPTLKSIGERRGLYDYKIVKGTQIVTDDDIDNYLLPCKILIKPTKSAEEIPVYFTLTPTGADFNEVTDSQTIIEE